LYGTAIAHRPLAWQARQEVARRQIVRFIFIFYWFLVLEGALRKWGAPQFGQVIFFIRVPVALLVYATALRTRLWPRSNVLMLGFYVFSGISLPLVLIQFVLGGYGAKYLLVAGYGWMNYFFYIPLAFIVGEQFRENDIQRLIKHTTWLVIAATPIVLLQFFSPNSSVINLGSGLDESTQFRNLGAALGFVRPTGFFTSTSGQALFVTSALALLLPSFLQRHRLRGASLALHRFGAVAITLMAIFGQSRLLFAMASLVLAAASLGGIISGKQRVLFRSLVGPVVLVVAVAALWPLLFPTSFDVFVTRWSVAAGYETRTFEFGFLGRALFGFYGFVHYIPDTPFFGYLLGLGGNAASQLAWIQLPRAAMEWQGYGQWAEGGWARHIIELGPPLGICFIIFRVSLTSWLGMIVIRATRLSGNILPVVLFGFEGLLLLNGQITGNGTINGYAWVFFGFCIASARVVCFSPTVRKVRTSAKKVVLD